MRTQGNESRFILRNIQIFDCDIFVVFDILIECRFGLWNFAFESWYCGRHVVIYLVISLWGCLEWCCDATRRVSMLEDVPVHGSQPDSRMPKPSVHQRNLSLDFRYVNKRWYNIANSLECLKITNSFVVDDRCGSYCLLGYILNHVQFRFINKLWSNGEGTWELDVQIICSRPICLHFYHTSCFRGLAVMC